MNRRSFATLVLGLIGIRRKPQAKPAYWKCRWCLATEPAFREAGHVFLHRVDTSKNAYFGRTQEGEFPSGMGDTVKGSVIDSERVCISPVSSPSE